ncbi:hypothetical protein M3649_04350 [Ureibacillus chungkukjangi]|uniref:hypothetical protein n=1 Tax=Ureibacillus chungkukjangi TaxID=1202712 RepID=UPI00203ADC1D|nr:hypothetical protein [Ureibacillus chungkukjangi]
MSRVNSTDLLTVPTRSNGIQKSSIPTRSNVKKVVIPFAVVTTMFLLGIPEVSAAGFKDFSLNPLQPIVDDWEAVKTWFKNLPHNIAEWSIELMAKLYELCTSLILKTPLWLFDNEWFKNTTYKFSLIAIGIVSVLTSVEGIKRMLPKYRGKAKPMDLKDISKRWFLVAGAMSITPWLFQKAFQGLNYVSELLISMGADNMRTNALPDNIKLIDILILIGFDALLISTLIPVLWKNGRKFFDLMILGVSAPFALSAWIFDSYRGWYKQWWSNLSHLALTQIFHALFLLILGFFIYGVPTPSTFTGMIIKILVVAGGFARLQSPPRLISGRLDTGEGFDEVTGSFKKSFDGMKRNIEFTKGLLTKNPKKILSALSKDRMSAAKILPIKKGNE